MPTARRRRETKLPPTPRKTLAKLLKLQPNQVLPASTGVIGVELDENLILSKLPELVERLNDTGLPDVARAILTTDLQPKGASREVTLRRGIVRLAGVTKGSGMIHPRMATTLAFVMTDAVIPQTLLRRMLVRATELSYNRISVDGDTSTNDTLIVLANGASGVRPDPKEMSVFEEALTETLQSLARQIVRDGEGARKLIAVEVHGAISDAAAAAIARSISNSPLVKTAIAGSDPNWGRILSAAGNSGVNFDPTQVDITLQDVKVCRNGLAAPFDEADMKLRLDDTDVSIVFRIAGKGKGTRDVLDVRSDRGLHPHQCELPHLGAWWRWRSVAVGVGLRAAEQTPFASLAKLARRSARTMPTAPSSISIRRCRATVRSNRRSKL